MQIGPIQVDPPVVLAPMAGVTNAPFRRLCREFGAGLYVSEMIGARGLIEGNEKTLALASFDDDEKPRSIQLYGTDPSSLGEAVSFLVESRGVDHIDMNFGCPMGKVTRHGGGAALPWKKNLFRSIVRAAVGNAGPVPVTVKFRKGIDDDHLTFLETGLIAEEEGVTAVALHARTAQQLYSGTADWSAIRQLKEAVTSIPVLGNGDIWTADDALRMVEETGCDGVVIGRGCLGRPWLFRDLADAFAGREPSTPPNLGEVGEIMVRHACYSWTTSGSTWESGCFGSIHRGISRVSLPVLGFETACPRWTQSTRFENSSVNSIPISPIRRMPTGWSGGTPTARDRSAFLTTSCRHGPLQLWVVTRSRWSAEVELLSGLRRSCSSGRA